MNSADRPEFYKIVNDYMVNWDKSIDGKALELWWLALKDLYLSEIHRAFEICLKNSKFAPRPADIRRKVTGQEGEGGTIEHKLMCEANGCNNRWSIHTDGKYFCRIHFGVRPRNWLQENWQAAMGAASALDKIGEQRARGAYGDAIVNAVLMNPQNNYFGVVTEWTYEKEHG